jgi:hypothetical protein
MARRGRSELLSDEGVGVDAVGAGDVEVVSVAGAAEAGGVELSGDDEAVAGEVDVSDEVVEVVGELEEAEDDGGTPRSRAGGVLDDVVAPLSVTGSARGLVGALVVVVAGGSPVRVESLPGPTAALLPSVWLGFLWWSHAQSKSATRMRP